MAQPVPSGVLSAEEALKSIRARSLQSKERDQLREAGRKKLEEYRKLKASVMSDIEKKLTSFTATPLTPTPTPTALQHPGTGDADPMVDVLLEQVSSLMADRQRLQASCSSLQRENEQLTELVGYLSLEQQQLLEQQQQHQQLATISDEDAELDSSWFADNLEHDLTAADESLPAATHSSSVASMDAVFAVEDDSVVETLQRIE